MLLALALTSSALGADLRIAVAEFDNAADTATYDALGKGLQAMVTTDLAQVDGLVLVERDRLTEVVSELELGQSGLVDVSTAARVGKLLGATHVVMGTFTVVDAAMRLDARLVDVGTGTVAVAADAHGDKDAFFELEKDLVKALVAAVDAELTPKERAAIGRIHTADFEAFEAFSEGVALYDSKRYDEAVATLEKVLVKDEEFKLARMTLEAYEALIAAVREKARAITVTEGEIAFAARQTQAKFEADTVARLQAVADDPATAFEDRITALYLLARGLPPHRFSSSSRFRELQDVEDEFLLYRASETAFARIYAEMRPKWPERTPFLTASEGPSFKEDKPFDESLAGYRAKLFGETYAKYNLRACTGEREILDLAGEMLHLDGRERAAELDRLSEEGRACIGERDYVGDRFEVAEAWVAVLELDQATAVLEKLATDTVDTAVLDRIGHKVGEIKKIATFLEEDRPKSASTWAETVLLAQKGSFTSHHPTWRAEVREGGPRGLWQLARLRALGPSVSPEFLWIGDELVWVLPPSPGELQTGPRSDKLRATSLRYYGNAEPEVSHSVVIGSGEILERTTPAPPPAASWLAFGMGTRGDVTVSMDLDYRPADDWWPVQRPPPREGEAVRAQSPGRPKVGVVLGMRDLETPALCDPTGVGMTSFPMTAWAVVLDGDTVRLGRAREVDEDLSKKSCSSFTDFVDAWAFDPVSSAAVGAGGATRHLSVSVSGTAVTVKVDKTTRKFTLPEAVRGFPGMVVDGVGYVEISALTVD